MQTTTSKTKPRQTPREKLPKPLQDLLAKVEEYRESEQYSDRFTVVDYITWGYYWDQSLKTLAWARLYDRLCKLVYHGWLVRYFTDANWDTFSTDWRRREHYHEFRWADDYHAEKAELDD